MNNWESGKKDGVRMTVIGLGYVGLPLALLADERGYTVFGIDTNMQKLAQLKRKISPFVDDEISKKLQNTTITFTDDISGIEDSEVIVICVPTPVDKDYKPDLEPVIHACKSIAPHIVKGHLVILESTVNPGVTESVVMPILENGSSLRAGIDFSVAHCPERINPGDKKWSISNIPRVVGCSDREGLRRSLHFYRSIVDAEVKPMGSLKEAEAVKVVENSFRDINIAFVNELALSFSRLGIDVVRVIEGAATKPFSFMAHYPGCGVGGHCIPVDPYYLIEYAKRNGFQHDFLALARRINLGMPHFTVELVKNGLNDKKIALNGTRVAVLGLAYKPNIDDARESPSLHIIKYLKEEGADVIVYDPYVKGDKVVDNLESALRDSKAVVVATAHDEFLNLDPEKLKRSGVEVVVDGRNCLSKERYLEAGLMYKGIGR